MAAVPLTKPERLRWSSAGSTGSITLQRASILLTPDEGVALVAGQPALIVAVCAASVVVVNGGASLFLLE